MLENCTLTKQNKTLEVGQRAPRMLDNSTTELYPNMCPILDDLAKVSIMKTLPKIESMRFENAHLYKLQFRILMRIQFSTVLSFHKMQNSYAKLNSFNCAIVLC